MKNLYPVLYALLFSAVVTAISILTHVSENCHSSAGSMETAGGLLDEANCGRIELKLGSGEDRAEMPDEALFTAVNTWQGLAEETELNTEAAAPNPRRAGGIAGLQREALMAEANRIMLELYSGGWLTKPIGYSCAFTDTSPDTSAAKSILGLFRDMHQKHLALAKSALMSGDQDSLSIRGWSDLRVDLARIQHLAEDLRNETALAAR